MPRLEKVLVGVDFSETSLAAARWTANHFAAEAEVRLVHSVETPPLSVFYRAVLPPRTELVELARSPARERLEALARGLRDGGASAEVRSGRPAEEIAAAAAEWNADVIVVGEHGRHRGIWGDLGSTAERLLHCADRAILLARGLPDGVPKSIMVPVEEANVTPLVLTWANLLRARFGAQLHAVHVVSQLLHSHVRLVSTPEKTRAVETEALKAAEGWLEEQLETAGFEDGEISADVMFGHPSYQILAVAQRHGVDMIVMGSRGAGAVGRTMMGSVASSVVRRAACPVLIIVERSD